MKKKKMLILIGTAIVFVIAAALIAVGLSPENLGTPDTPANRNTYTVTFYSDNDSVLKIEAVQENDSAVPPGFIQLTYGNIFQSWDKDLTNVTENMDIYPEYADIRNKDNAFAIAGVYANPEDDVTVSVMLGGEVCVSGFDMIIRYDAEAFQLEAIVEDGAVIYNADTPGEIRLNYVSVENTVASVDICDLTFKSLTEKGEYPITLEMVSIYACEDKVQSIDDTLYIPPYTIVNGMIYIIP